MEVNKIIVTLSKDETNPEVNKNAIVELAKAVADGGGTKLYKHSFTIEDEDMHVYNITIINNSSNAITSLGNVGELLKGTATNANDPDPSPEYFIFIEYEEETEIGAAYHLTPASMLIPASGTTYSTDTVIPL